MRPQHIMATEGEDVASAGNCTQSAVDHEQQLENAFRVALFTPAQGPC